MAERELQARQELKRQYALGLENGYTDGYGDGLHDGWSSGFDYRYKEA
jgi:hypothetical protein